MSSPLIGMFAKHWLPGQCKTRLAKSIGFENAAWLHRRFVQHLIARINPNPFDKQLVFSPPHRQSEFQRMIRNTDWHLHAQSPGDLGQRMQSFFAHAFTAGYQRVVLIGSDSPDLPDAIIQNAFAKLTSHDVVLSPTTDGGYCLVGQRRFVPTMFASIKWSSSRVFHDTTERLAEQNVSFATLGTWHDIDTVDDLQAFMLRSQSSRTTSENQSLLQDVRSVLATHGCLN